MCVPLGDNHVSGAAKRSAYILLRFEALYPWEPHAIPDAHFSYLHWEELIEQRVFCARKHQPRCLVY